MEAIFFSKVNKRSITNDWESRNEKPVACDAHIMVCSKRFLIQSDNMNSKLYSLIL